MKLKTQHNTTLALSKLQGIAHHLFKTGDVSFSVGRRQFKADKIVLSASPVFAGKFKIDGRARPLANLKIKNCEPQAFEAMLRFLYTDEMEETEEMAKKLLPIANKYQLQSLRNKCESILKKTISKAN